MEIKRRKSGQKTKKEEKKENSYQENEINGNFRITSEKWNDKLLDSNSVEYKNMEENMKRGLYDMLTQDEFLMEQAEFEIEIVGFRCVIMKNLLKYNGCRQILLFQAWKCCV